MQNIRHRERRTDGALTIREVCDALRMSRATFYRKRSGIPLVELKGLPGMYSATRLKRFLDTGR